MSDSKRKGGGKRRRDLRKVKNKEALERKAGWDTLSTEMKLQELDRRLGKGIGAKRQRARLQTVAV